MKWLRLFRHQHKWLASRVSLYHVVYEQKCVKCGAYRHLKYPGVAYAKSKANMWLEGRARGEV